MWRYSDFQVMVRSKETGPGMEAAVRETESSQETGSEPSEAREVSGNGILDSESALEPSETTFAGPGQEENGESSQEAMQ